MKVTVHGYHAGNAWLCIYVGVEPPFLISWIRHCTAITFVVFNMSDGCDYLDKVVTAPHSNEN